MAFLFKSKKQQDAAIPKTSRNITSADGYKGDPRLGPPPPVGTAGPMNARGVSSPTPPGERAIPPRAESEMGHHQGPRSAPQRPAPDMSLYPWSQRRLDFPSMGQNPFPRYGAASNSVSSKEGDVYLMGGLINGSMVKGDLWVVETGKGSLTCYPVPTTAEGPGPRVGHASLLVGNAYIVFGGDTKVDEMDVLDDTLYLLNTSTKHWSRALPAGPRPSGRYGHTLNILGSKIFIFGGQVEGFFFNDLVAFDLNQLQSPTNQWEILLQSSTDGGPPLGQVPPARTNHTIITYQEKLYLFGGTDGSVWFNDVWVYDPETNRWTLQECIGFIPCPREGHAAALVGDVMYVFGGRTEEGKDLGDLAAYRIPTRRWYTFQNMGPSPSPRSGHGMTSVGSKILVLAGEPSSAPRDAGELSLAYVLDTSKIRYPNDAPSGTQTAPQPQGAVQPQQTRQPGMRRPSAAAEQGRSDSRSESRQAGDVVANGPLQRFGSSEVIREEDPLQQQPPPSQMAAVQQGPRRPLNPTQPGPPPAQQAPQPVPPGSQTAPMQPGPSPGQPPRMMNGAKPALAGSAFNEDRGRDSPARMDSRLGRVQAQDRPSLDSLEKSQWAGTSSPPSGQRDVVPQNHGYSGHSSAYTSEDVTRKNSLQQIRAGSAAGRRQDTFDSAADVFSTPVDDANKQIQMPGGFPVDSGVGSSPAMTHTNHHETHQRELEQLRIRNAWYESELALARKAGYRTSLEEAVSGENKTMSVGEESRPLLEALLKMRNELVAAQQAMSDHSMAMGVRVAQAEKERDAAVSEALHAKTHSLARQRGLGSGFDGREESDRAQETSRRLALTLAAHKNLSSKVEALGREISVEREARQLAEESANHAHARASELDQHKQESSSEVERLRGELHEAQRTAREEAAARAEAFASSKMLQVDRDDLHRKHSAAVESTRNHTAILASLRDAVSASTGKSELLEQQLEEERRQRSLLQEKLTRLRSEHEERSSELETASRRLQESEEAAATHRAEAEKHRGVVLAGLGSSVAQGEQDVSANDERVQILQQQLNAANTLVRQNQSAADVASEKLRRAEERIAGLEAYQEQASREGLSLRKQLQLASTSSASLHAEKADLQQKVADHAVELTALQGQHNAVKNLLHERGIDTSGLHVEQAPLSERFQEIESQLEASRQANEEMRVSFEQREQEASRGWEEKIVALDNDYQSAVKYLKGTEKMLSKMKSELQRYKTQNKEMEDKLSGERGSPAPGGWETEKAGLQREIEDMQARNRSASSDLERQMSAARSANLERDALQQQLDAARERSREADGLRTRNAELEARVIEAERKAHMLLETVGTTVNNYRRESQQLQANGVAAALPGAAAGDAIAPGTGTQHGHSRNLSANSISAESSYSNDHHQGGEDVLSRNSMALDALASELEGLRSHWETTNKNYRRSDASDMLEKGTASENTDGQAGLSGSLASWRKKLDSRNSVDEKA